MSHQESGSTMMRAVRAVKAGGSSPTWYEVVIGTALIGVALWAYLTGMAATTFCVIVGGIGFYMVAPVRAERIWSEVRRTRWIRSKQGTTDADDG